MVYLWDGFSVHTQSEDEATHSLIGLAGSIKRHVKRGNTECERLWPLARKIIPDCALAIQGDHRGWLGGLGWALEAAASTSAS